MRTPQVPGSRLLLTVAVLFLVAGAIVFALPHRLEGPVLMRISPGHGLATNDLIALGPLLTGSALLVRWRARGALCSAAIRRSGVATALAAGMGLGLLIASVFSTFSWWWAVGVVLLTVALTLTSMRATPR
ncbi:MAG: hypothetical protein ACRDZ4_19085 [Egibacteraceae bacterium]